MHQNNFVPYALALAAIVLLVNVECDPKTNRQISTNDQEIMSKIQDGFRGYHDIFKVGVPKRKIEMSQEDLRQLKEKAVIMLNRLNSLLNSQPDKLNPYSRILTEQYDYLQTLVLRMETFIDYSNNPFLVEWGENTANDLRLMLVSLETMITFYEEGNSRTKPNLTATFNQLKVQAQKDIGWLEEKNHRQAKDIKNLLADLDDDVKNFREANMITDHGNHEDIYELAQKVMKGMSDLQHLCIRLERQFNMNYILFYDNHNDE